jgi:hypothetical protein
MEKRHISNKKTNLIICEIVFCGLDTTIVNIVIQMPTAENSIRYRAVIDRNYCYRRELKKREMKRIQGSRTSYEKKGISREKRDEWEAYYKMNPIILDFSLSLKLQNNHY